MAEDWTNITEEHGEENAQQNGDTVSRRQFVTAVVAATAGSIATGVSVALYNSNKAQQLVDQIPAPVPTTDFSPVIEAADTAQQELLAKLAAAQAENIRLQSELDSTKRRLEIAEQSAGTASDEVSLLRAELTTSQEQQGILAGLVMLYEQLDNVDLTDIVTNGLNNVSSLFTGIMDELPTWEEGLESSEVVLAEFEEHLPVLAAGRDWLSERLANLAGIHAVVEERLQGALDRIAPVLELLQEWFDDILKWLPFGMGRKALDVMTALTALMQETPQTIQTVQTNVSLPLDQWLKPESGKQQPVIQTKLFQPVREKAIRSGQKGIGMVKTVQGTYQSELVGKVATRIADRRIVRDLITQYRSEHSLSEQLNRS